MSLNLYYLEGCPFCTKVLDYLKSNPIKINLINLETTPSARDHLIKNGGKSQVPCLKIDDQFLYESNDIIEWLKQKITNH